MFFFQYIQHHLICVCGGGGGGGGVKGADHLRGTIIEHRDRCKVTDLLSHILLCPYCLHQLLELDILACSGLRL